MSQLEPKTNREQTRELADMPAEAGEEPAGVREAMELYEAAVVHYVRASAQHNYVPRTSSANSA